ncbi:MAG: lactate racemase domain-containing protein [Acidimicrobiales bacterium]
MPRPGFVLDVDRSTPPILFHHGESLKLERLPAGRSRVLYPAEPLEALEDPDTAIRFALENPLGDSAPLRALLTPGMKLTIAFDDISLPLPPMRRPDVRQRVIEAVLDVAAAAGVDDVHLIAALALHRRMTEAELRHAVGDRVYDAFAPHGLLYNHDAEDPDNLAFIGATPHGEEVEISKRAAESDLIVYVNINLVSMDGGWKSTATGLASYKSLRHHHNVKTMRASRSFMDRHKSELHSSNWRMGEVLKASGIKVFQIETTLNNDTFGTSGPMSVLQKREWEWTARDRATFIGMKAGLDRLPLKARRKIFNSWLAPYGITSVQAGEVDAVHEVTTENVFKQQLVTIEGQTDILTMGLPYICPYNVNSIMNPILVMCLGLGYFFNMYRGEPLVREGGVLIMSHPTPWEFHPVHHPSYIDFFEQVLAETTDPIEIESRYEKQYAEDEWYRHLYRTSHAYHGVHPFYMWYWGSHALAHLGKVIIVGGEPRSVRRLGFTPASTLNDALEMASDVVGRDATITHLHNPPIVMADVT